MAARVESRALIQRHPPCKRAPIVIVYAYPRIRIEPEIQQQLQYLRAIAVNREAEQPATMVARRNQIFLGGPPAQKCLVAQDHCRARGQFRASSTQKPYQGRHRLRSADGFAVHSGHIQWRRSVVCVDVHIRAMVQQPARDSRHQQRRCSENLCDDPS